VCLREQRETRLPLTADLAVAVMAATMTMAGWQWCMVLSFSVPSRDTEPGNDKSKNRDEAKAKESSHEFTCVYAPD